MLDCKILDCARRLIEGQFTKSRRVLPDKINCILRKKRIVGMQKSGPEHRAVRVACEQEIREKIDIVWESLQKAHKAYGSPRTKTMAIDLKQEISHHIEKIVKDASELMAKRLRLTEPNAELANLEKTQSEVKKEYDVKVDVYVASLKRGEPAEKQNSVKPQEEGGRGGTDIPEYRAIDLAKRTLTIGTKTWTITSEKVWDFLKDLCSALRDDRLVSRYEGANDNKNNVDQLRRQIDKDNIHKLIILGNRFYKLNSEVKILNSGQIGIRKTHLSRNRK